MLVDKGSQVFYVEFEQNDRTKRFIIPNGDNINQKIKSFTEQIKHVVLDLTRIGTATVTSKLDIDDMGSGLEGIDSDVDTIFDLSLDDHPVISQGQGRYSPDLIKSIMEIETQDDSTEKEENEEPKLDLTSVLKQQVAQKAINKVSSDKTNDKPDIPKAPVVKEENMTLTEFVENNKKQKQPMSLYGLDKRQPSRPISKIDKILEKVNRIEYSLGLDDTAQQDFSSREDELRGEQLQQWFDDSVKENGLDATFELLASKIKL
jgi:hypothetical protein